MNPTKVWNVRPSQFPFGISDTILGVVNGADHRDAQQKAEDLYGRAVVVEPSRERQKSPEEIRHGSDSPEFSASRPDARVDAQRRLADALRPVREVPRPMTSDEARMAVAVSCCEQLRHSKHRGLMRVLHARTLRPDRSITPGEAATLRAVVITFAAKLPVEIVALAKPAADGGRA